VIITALFPQLERADDPTLTQAECDRAQTIVDGFTSSNSAHANCARSFRASFQSSRANAGTVFDDAANIVIGTS
jgi:hypothetical protein